MLKKLLLIPCLLLCGTISLADPVTIVETYGVPQGLPDPCLVNGLPCYVPGTPGEINIYIPLSGTGTYPTVGTTVDSARSGGGFVDVILRFSGNQVGPAVTALAILNFVDLDLKDGANDPNDPARVVFFENIEFFAGGSSSSFASIDSLLGSGGGIFVSGDRFGQTITLDLTTLGVVPGVDFDMKVRLGSEIFVNRTGRPLGNTSESFTAKLVTTDPGFDVPEPSSLALLVCGLAGVMGFLPRRRDR